MKSFLDKIIIDAHIMAGKPVIKGTRITVQYILDLLAQGITTEEIIQEYPHVTEDDICACLWFTKNTL